jgi:hypothetical protein
VADGELAAALKAAAGGVTLVATLVLLVGLARALWRPSAAAMTFGAALSLALELLLGAGLLRLPTVNAVRGFAAVAAIIVLRRVIGLGLRYAQRAAAS